ncbi:hypothetical protein HPTD01_752 [Halomonas sp. TD01]|nr:hypothetical protein HPTD01_752 [Halomonas sp. TD01]
MLGGITLKSHFGTNTPSSDKTILQTQRYVANATLEVAPETIDK